jgi:uncharacterized coiled-coil protein SlyX
VEVLMGYFIRLKLDSDFLVETCFTCGMTFGFSKSFYDVVKRTHEEFYCPRGHSQYYSQKTDQEKCKEEIKKLEERLASKDRTIVSLNDDLNYHKKRFNGIKGQFVKLKKKIKKPSSRRKKNA